MVTQTLPCIFLIIYIKDKLNFEYSNLFKNGFKILFSSFVMMVVLYLFKLFIPTYSFGRINSLMLCALYGLIGVIVYTFMLIKTGVMNELFGNSRIMKKLRLVK